MYKILFLKNLSEIVDVDGCVEALSTHAIEVKVVDISEIDDNYQLDCNFCIICIDEDVKLKFDFWENFIKQNSTVEFCGANKFCAKSDILFSYDIGCKNFIQIPINSTILLNIIKSNLERVTDKKNDLILKIENKPSILIVDDNEMNMELLEEVIRPLNLHPVCFNDPNKALLEIESTNFDLIILDIMMPGINGFEVAKCFKESKKNRNTPILFVSALKNPQTKVKSFDLGSYGYIEKPFNIGAMRAQIKSVLEIKKLQDSLREEKDKLDKILNFSSDEIILADSDFNISSSNNHFVENGSNLNFIDLIRNENSKETLDKLKSFYSSPDKNLSIQVNLKNNYFSTKIHTNTNISKIFDENKQLSGFIIVMRDISEEMIVEAQKETFIAMITHDLKTPIRAQIRALELLMENKMQNDEKEEILTEILNSCRFMQYMTDNLLLKYKYENGQMKIKKEPASLKELIEKSVENLKYLFRQKFQTVSIKYNADIIEFEFDSNEIERVINNLLANASEYSDCNTEILIEVNHSKDVLEVSFTDFGFGIAKEDLKNIFDEYTSGAKKFRKVGAGLGLFICKRIVEEHGGQISVKSKLSEGSTFTFTLPFNQVLAY